MSKRDPAPSVHRYNTPLRYPGGKQRLTPFILELMEANDLVGGEYAEPYAGGAGVAIALLLRGKVSHIHLNDRCKAVYAFWRSVLNKTDEFCRRVSDARLSVKEWRRQQEILARASEFDQVDIGFSAFYLNRCNRSGILAGGLIGGIKQTGEWKMGARFPRKELIRRIEAIAEKRDAITLKNLDAEKFIVEYLPRIPKGALVYCDPPYYHKSKRLYLNDYTPDDHIRMAKVIQRKIKQRWIVSYDDAPEIAGCYASRKSFSYRLPYHAATVYEGVELFFVSDSLKLPVESAIPSISRALQRLS